MHKSFLQNVAGRDYIVGDIHGCFSRLQAHLDQLGFDAAVDRLFSVGDLVDRGPESAQALEWLDKPWFHAVRGNHEQMAIDHVAGNSDARTYIGNGGGWFLALTRPEQRQFADAFGALPIAITLDTAAGQAGIVGRRLHQAAAARLRAYADPPRRAGRYTRTIALAVGLCLAGPPAVRRALLRESAIA